MLLLFARLVALVSAILEPGDVIFDPEYKNLLLDRPRVGKEAAEKLLLEIENFTVTNYNDIPLTNTLFGPVTVLPKINAILQKLVADAQMDFQIYLEVGTVHETGKDGVMEGLREMYMQTGPLCTLKDDGFNLTDIRYPYVSNVAIGEHSSVAQFDLNMRFCNGRLVTLQVQLTLERETETRRLVYLIKHLKATPKHGDLPRNIKGVVIDYDYQYVEDKASSAIETAVLQPKTFPPILFKDLLSKRRALVLSLTTKPKDPGQPVNIYQIAGMHGKDEMTLDKVQDYFKRVADAAGELQKLRPDVTIEEITDETIRSVYTVFSETTHRQIEFRMLIHKKMGYPYMEHISTMSHWQNLWKIYGLHVTEK